MDRELKFRSTTILGVRKNNKAALAGDGQVTFGDTVIKSNTVKVRRMHENKVLAGFAGAAADAFTLFEKFEAKLQQYKGNLYRASVELAKEWRTDKYLRRLEAQLAVMDLKSALIISGNGDVLEPDDGIIAIGSGAPYALSAARALIKFTDLPAENIVSEAMKIASNICIYTNENITVEKLPL